MFPQGRGSEKAQSRGRGGQRGERGQSRGHGGERGRGRGHGGIPSWRTREESSQGDSWEGGTSWRSDGPSRSDLRGGRGHSLMERGNRRGRANALNGLLARNPEHYISSDRGTGFRQQKGPQKPSTRKVSEVFTRKILVEYLRMEPNCVIMSLCTVIKKWNEFLSSDEDMKSDSGLLTLVLQILGDKICSDDVTLSQQQIQILTGTTSTQFRTRLVEYCTRITLGLAPVVAQEPREDAGASTALDFVEVDSSPVTFLTNLFTYCTFLCNKMPETSVDYLQGVIIAATIAIISSGENFTPVKQQQLKDDFNGLKTHIGELVKRKEKCARLFRPSYDNFLTEEEQQELHAMEAPDDYRDIPVIPSVKELLSKEDVFLRPNIVKGAYSSPLHYLDVQFRLLREDFVRPLRQGIQDFLRYRNEYLSRKKRLPNGSVRIYPDIRIVGAELARDTYVYKAELPENSYRRVNWEKSKRLMSGSLVVFTADFFVTTFFGIIGFRNLVELQKGILSFTWVGAPPVWDRNVLYLMIECEIFFEPYRHTLETLKVLKLEEFPMCKFIVGGSSEVAIPSYLISDEKLMTIRLKDSSNRTFPPKKIEDWPSSDELGLDSNQFNAFQAALTSQFVIIQGPPGTGKTFLGLRVAEVLLQNSNLWKESLSDDGPIFVVCYTNHALDQFLEGILDIMRTKLDRMFLKDSFDSFGKKLKRDIDPSALIRVGGRSKSEELQTEFSLRNVTKLMKDRSMLSHDYRDNEYTARRKVIFLQESRQNLLGEFQALKNSDGIVNFQKLEVLEELRKEFPEELLTCLSNINWLQLISKNFTAQTDLNLIVNDWFEFETNSRDDTIDVGFSLWEIDTFMNDEPEIKIPQDVSTVLDVVEEDYDVQEILDQRMVDDLYVENTSSQPVGKQKEGLFMDGWAISECQRFSSDLIEAMDYLYNQRLGTEPSEADLRLHIDAKMGALNQKLEMLPRKEAILQKLFKAHNTGLLKLPNIQEFILELKDKLEAIEDANWVQSIENQKENREKLMALDIRKRWALYFTVAEAAAALFPAQLRMLDKEILEAEKKLCEIQRYGQGLALKSAKVVGMTTTGAAKYHDLVKMMRAKIVIVEEAAEVLESHIVTCISKYCEHLILIGDHLQLRPSTTVHQLAKQYKLEISLFERMLNNDLSCYRLKVQHRMRPEIANLVVGTVYDELENHTSVTQYPHVLGMSKNLFFMNHNEPEKSDPDSLSKSNAFEARYVVSLCKYLLAQGYSSDQVTILTTYTGQMFVIKKVVNEMLGCRVKVTCVDNYQGEENDIILLSLVRSNPEGNIGFLKVDNRVCVALSRAKIGLYIFGNMKILSDKSKIWPKINEKLLARDEIGSTISIKCQIHGGIREVKDERDFQVAAPRGGCLRDCDTELECGHKCSLVCHIIDRDHKEYQCREQCTKKCSNDHPCVKKCFKECPPCCVQVENTLNCLHVVRMPCYWDATKYDCAELVLKSLLCGHEEQLRCSMDPSNYKCLRKSIKELSCKHEKEVECHEDLSAIRCKILMDKVLPCGHSQQVECWRDPGDDKCQTLVMKEFEDCHHRMEVQCWKRNTKLQCMEICQRAMNCGHNCPQFCHTDRDPNHLLYKCEQPCTKKCSGENQHECTNRHLCYQSCPPCKAKVHRILEGCYHLAEMNCSSDYLTFKCKDKCSAILECGHKCPQMCSQPCGGCKANVPKLVDECGHEINFPCSQTPRRSACVTLVHPAVTPKCGHSNIVVPCSISDHVTGEELTTKYCKEPCLTEPLSCGHKCQGNCQQCYQGTLHVKCSSKCGKILICGHNCKSTCSISCPPCMDKCSLGCEHTRCKMNCSSACKPCKQKCTWQCEHKQCTKLCNEICDRDPCSEPCSVLLPCGHPCLGFCGETCPTLCGVCNEQEIDVGDQDARFVLLPDCNHTIESSALQAYVDSSLSEVGMLACPICSSVIVRCRRLNNIIKSRIATITLIKTEILKSFNNVKEHQSILINKIQQIDAAKKHEKTVANVFPALYSKLASQVTNKAARKNKRGVITGFKYSQLQIEGPELETVLFLFDVASSAADLLIKTSLQKGLYNELKKMYAEVIDKQFLHLRHPLGISEFQDINTQLERLSTIRQLFVLKSSSEFFEHRNKIRPLYYQILNLLEDYNVHKKLVTDLLKSLKSDLEIGVEFEYHPIQISTLVYGYQLELWTKMTDNQVVAII